MRLNCFMKWGDKEFPKTIDLIMYSDVFSADHQLFREIVFRLMVTLFDED